MKYFVTGGAGFIGSNFIRYILKKYDDREIVNFDLLTYAGNPENLTEGYWISICITAPSTTPQASPTGPHIFTK